MHCSTLISMEYIFAINERLIISSLHWHFRRVWTERMSSIPICSQYLPQIYIHLVLYGYTALWVQMNCHHLWTISSIQWRKYSNDFSASYSREDASSLSRIEKIDVFVANRKHCSFQNIAWYSTCCVYYFYIIYTSFTSLYFIAFGHFVFKLIKELHKIE